MAESSTSPSSTSTATTSTPSTSTTATDTTSTQTHSVEGPQAELIALLRAAVSNGNGCLMAAKPAIVFRGTYAGRNIVGNNSVYSKENVDHRGYVPVEWWVMSKTIALNPELKEHEGVTVLRMSKGTDSNNKDNKDAQTASNTHTDAKNDDAAADDDDDGSDEDGVRFNDAVKAAGELLLGKYVDRWPLTKVLDIGGKPVTPRFLPGDDEAVMNQLLQNTPTTTADSKDDDDGDGDNGTSSSTDNKDSATATASQEIPPIPCHVHCGDFGGDGCGKLEAYFFPPLDVPPYNLNVAGKLRLFRYLDVVVVVVIVLVLVLVLILVVLVLSLVVLVPVAWSNGGCGDGGGVCSPRVM